MMGYLAQDGESQIIKETDKETDRQTLCVIELLDTEKK